MASEYIEQLTLLAASMSDRAFDLSAARTATEAVINEAYGDDANNTDEIVQGLTTTSDAARNIHEQVLVHGGESVLLRSDLEGIAEETASTAGAIGAILEGSGSSLAEEVVDAAVSAAHLIGAAVLRLESSETQRGAARESLDSLIDKIADLIVEALAIRGLFVETGTLAQEARVMVIDAADKAQTAAEKLTEYRGTL